MNENVLERAKCPELDKILGKPFNVLNHGFVRVVDYCGNENSIVQAARVSYGNGTKSVSEDSALIRYLFSHEHMSPFEMPVIRLHIKAPIFVFRQWHRHRTASINEISARYSILSDEMEKCDYMWRKQSPNNKQGSLDEYIPIDEARILKYEEEKLHEDIQNVYNKRLDNGVAREVARKDLPVSTYSEMYWQCNARNLLHFLGLRMDEHAQKEIRDYANIIGREIVAKWLPTVWDSFLEYQFNAVKLSSKEQEIVSIFLNKDRSLKKYVEEIGWYNAEKNKPTREFKECLLKLEKLGFKLPKLPFDYKK